MSTGLESLTISDARDGLACGDFSSLELTQARIGLMDAARNLNIFITETPELAIKRAKDSDQRRAKGVLASGMDGIPIAVKDLFCTEGISTTAGSRILDGYIPPYESTVSRNLNEAGSIMLGKTNMDERIVSQVVLQGARRQRLLLILLWVPRDRIREVLFVSQPLFVGWLE